VKLAGDKRGKMNMAFGRMIFAIAFALVLSGSSGWAQTEKASDAKQSSTAGFVQQTFYLNNTSQATDGNEIVTALRNMVAPTSKIFFVPSQNAIVVSATSDQMEQAQKLLHELDRPKKTYRLTYTLTEIENGKRVGTQHYTMIVVAGLRTVMKQGSRVPIVVGTSDAGKATEQTQVQYLDVGMNFDATLEELANGIKLKTNVEQLSVAEERSSTLPQDPIIRQTSLQGSSFLTPGKPLILGSVDVAGSTRHIDIDVMMELVP
jgi:type II secretory pathway component GspD/PulD (secretin)